MQNAIELKLRYVRTLAKDRSWEREGERECQFERKIAMAALLLLNERLLFFSHTSTSLLGEGCWVYIFFSQKSRTNTNVKCNMSVSQVCMQTYLKGLISWSTTIENLSATQRKICRSALLLRCSWRYFHSAGILCWGLDVAMFHSRHSVASEQPSVSRVPSSKCFCITNKLRQAKNIVNTCVNACMCVCLHFLLE